MRTEPVLFVLRAQLQRLLRECVEDGRAAASVALPGGKGTIRRTGLEGQDCACATPQVAVKAAATASPRNPRRAFAMIAALFPAYLPAVTRVRKSRTAMLKICACSMLEICAADGITSSSAPGITPASLSALALTMTLRCGNE